MKVSIYTSAFNLAKSHGVGFDVLGALLNWGVYAQEIVFACGDQDSALIVEASAEAAGVPVKVVRTHFDFANDPFAYGKTENAALQACTGDLLLQANLDERWRVDPVKLAFLYSILEADPTIHAFFLPTIDLYGSLDRAVKVGRKWFAHRKGLQRGAVRFGLKADGRPSYDKTSTDELLLPNGDLVNAASLIDDLSIENVRRYVAAGNPITYHLGYLDLKDRAARAGWWRDFWLRATAGDPNSHITDVAELEKRHTFEHGLPLWPTVGGAK